MTSVSSHCVHILDASFLLSLLWPDQKEVFTFISVHNSGRSFFFVAENHNSCRARHGSRNRGPAELRNWNSGWATNPQALTPVIYLLQRISWGVYSLPKQHQQLEMKCLNTRAEGGQVTFKQHHQVLLSDAEEKDEKLGGHEEEKNPFTLNSNWHLCQKQSKDFSTMNNLGDPS